METPLPGRESPNADGTRPYLSLVIPVYNEVESVSELHSEILEVIAALPYAVEIIYVDDKSTDGSLELLRGLASKSDNGPTVRVLSFVRNFGQTAAMAAGFEAARGSVIVPLDADGQNDPRDIGKVVSRLDEGYDVVSGWRKFRKDKGARVLPSKVANWMIGRLSGVKLHDYGCTLKAYRAELLKQLHLYGEMHRFIPLYLSRYGARVTEEVVGHRARSKGVSKYGSRRIVKVFVDLFLIRFMSRYFNRPMHFFGKTAVGFFGLALGCAGLMVVFKYGLLAPIGVNYKASFVQTPLPSLSGVFLIAAVLSLFMGILAELLMRIHYEVQSLRPYRIAESFSSAGTLPSALP